MTYYRQLLPVLAIPAIDYAERRQYAYARCSEYLTHVTELPMPIPAPRVLPDAHEGFMTDVTVSYASTVEVFFAYMRNPDEVWSDWKLTAELDADSIVTLVMCRGNNPRLPKDREQFQVSVSGKAELDALIAGLTLLGERFADSMSGWEEAAGKDFRKAVSE